MQFDALIKHCIEIFTQIQREDCVPLAEDKQVE